MSIARNTIITLGTQVAFVGLQVVGAMMSTRLLGRTAYGQMTMVMTTAMLFATAFQFSLVYGSLKVWSEGDHKPGEIPATLFGLAAALSVCAVLVQEVFLLAAGAHFFEGVSFLALQIGLLMTPMMIFIPLMEHAAKLRNEIVLYNGCRLMLRAVSVAIICILVIPGILSSYGFSILLKPREMAGALVREPFPLTLFLLIATVAFLPSLLALYSWMRRDTARRADGCWKFNGNLAKRMLMAGYKTYLAMLALFLLTRIDYYIIKQRFDDDTVAIYGVATNLAEMVTMISLALNTALLPHASSPDSAAAHDVSARSMRHSLLYSSFSALLFILAAAPLVYLYGGARYQAAIEPLRFLLPGFVCYLLLGVYSMLAVRNGWFWGNNLILASAVVGELAGCLLMIDGYGLLGVATVKTLVFFFALVAYVVWFGRSGRLPIKALWTFDAIDVSIWRRIAGAILRRGRSTALSIRALGPCWEGAK